MNTISATTYIDLIRPQQVSRTTYNVLLAVMGSLAIAACAQIAIPLPFTPVPITGQTFMVLLLGIIYGSRLGAATAALYLAEGALGLPFFAGGNSGISIFGGATGGYLIGFVIAAYVVGLLAERKWDRKLFTAGAAMFLSSLIVLSFGTLWLSMFVGLKQAFLLGFLPFIPGDIVKTVLAASTLPLGWKYLGKRSGQF
jgi:biotin transport system substrate-specific component